MQAPKHSSLSMVSAPNGAQDRYADTEISLYYGEVRTSVIDLDIQTINGVLGIRRTYRQFCQDVLRFMGAGWSHSQHSKLRSHAGGIAYFMMPDGGDIAFYETAPNGSYYKAFPGLAAEMYWNNPPADPDNYYDIRFVDGNRYWFGVDGWLKMRQFPNGDTWTYTYQTNPSAYDVGLLRQVADQRGNQLLFRYYDTQGVSGQGFKHRQLWRIGDQSASGLAGSNPTGRFVTYDYIRSAPNNQLTLLSTVKDTLGQLWEYKYDTTLSWQGTTVIAPIKQFFSPAVISPSTNYTNDEILLRNLAYTWKNGTPNDGVEKITQSLGREGVSGTTYDLVQTYDFFRYDSANPRTEVTVAGKKTTHKFDGQTYNSTQSPDGDISSQTLNNNYQISQLVNGAGDASSFSWTTSGWYLEQATDADDYITRYEYESGDTVNGRLLETEDALGRITKYFYQDTTQPRKPTRVRVLNDTITIKETHFTYNSQGSITYEIELFPQYSPVAWSPNISDYPAWKIARLVENTYSSANKRMLTSTTLHDVNNITNNQTTTYSYDEWGRVIKAQRSSVLGSCQFTHTIFDYASRVTATICGTADLPPTYNLETLWSAANPDAYHVTIFEYDTMGRRIKERTNVGSPDAQAKYFYTDALSRPIRIVTNVEPMSTAWTAVGQWVWEQNAWKSFAGGTVISHGALKDQNLPEDLQYNELGKVRFKRDASGQVTLYGYTGKGNLKREIRSASNPLYFNSADLANRISLNSYTITGDPDLDLETAYSYDGASRATQIVQFDMEGDPGITRAYDYDKRGNLKREIINPTDDENLRAKPDYYLRSTRALDEVGRVSRIQTAFDYFPWEAQNKLQLRTTLYGFSSLDHRIKTIESASDPDYVVTNSGNHSLSNYPSGSISPSADADLDLITEAKFDVLGRKIYDEDVFNRRIWFAYDGLGRITRTVRNAVGIAEDGSVNDPRNPSYSINSAADLDLVTNTFYNTDGHVQRVQEIKDHANVNAYWTLYAYDDMGRVIREIRNAANSALYSGSWNDEYLVNDYGPLSPDSDKDLAVTTDYDDLGRVRTIKDERTGNETYTGYDDLGRVVITVRNYTAQGTSSPLNWEWSSANSRWEYVPGQAVDHGAKNDLNLIATTRYDVTGRIIKTRASDGAETQFELDKAGRIVKQIVNYVNGTYDPGFPDEDLMTLNTYNKAGNLLTTTDPRGTKTAFIYDRAGRKAKTIAAADTALATASYTCYNKAGEVLRVIQNYLPSPTTDPDKRTAPNTWEFNPATHGADNDENVITEYRYDKIERQVDIINPLGHTTSQQYDKAGQVTGRTDALERDTLFFYDLAGRLIKVIQAYKPQPIVGNPIDDPTYWYWESAAGQWRDMRGDIVEHGSDNARNLIVVMTYDKAGRMLTRREPRGNLTQFTYDGRDRRRTLTNPQNVTWETQYSDLTNGRTRESRIFPGLNGSTTPYTVQRDADRAGRMDSITFGDAASTPGVVFSYTLAGQRAQMDETGAGSTVRRTEYSYDGVHRLMQVRFDVDGSSTYDETIQYAYDAGGLRTQLTVVSDANRTVSYAYDARGHLSAMSYVAGKESGVSLLSSAEMTFTKTGLLKRIDRNPTNDVLSSRYAYDPAGRLLQIQHIFDDSTPLAQFDYTVNALGNRTQAMERRMPDATGPMVERTIQYAYDSASRLTGAIYYPNLTGSGSPLHTYGYTYDWSGNRLTETLDTVTRNFGYNAANQLTSEGATALTYDLNGNLLNDGTNAYVWDRANRLLSMGGASYAYDGDGDRHSRTVGGVLTRYTLDKQSALTKVLAEDTGSTRNRFVHGPMGIFGQQNNVQATNWSTKYLLEDGLGSIRALSDGLDVLSAQEYSPYGEQFETAIASGFGFTGEQTDALNDLVYLRARHLSPRLGVFGSRDRWMGIALYPLSLNRYSWVQGNVINRTDPSGLYSICSDVDISGPCLFSTGGGGGGSLVNLSTDGPPPLVDFLADFAVGFGIGIGVVASTAVVGIGLALLPPAVAITAGFGLVAAGINTVQQLENLGSLPENESANFLDLLGRINIGEAALSGIYGAGISATAFIAGPFTLVGAGAGALATVGAQIAQGQQLDSFSVVSNSFWGGITWGISSTINAKMIIDDMSLIARILISAPIHFGVGLDAVVMQTAIDSLVREIKPDGPLGYLFGAGLTNLASLFGKDVRAWPAQVAFTFAYLLSELSKTDAD